MRSILTMPTSHTVLRLVCALPPSSAWGSDLVLLYKQKSDGKSNDNFSMCHDIQEAEQKLEQVTRDRQRFLAEITNLKAALRDLMGRTELGAVVGKLHHELEHVR